MQYPDAAPPVFGLTVPGLQDLHNLVPTESAYEPGGHVTHADAAVLALKVPTAHCVHSVCPVEAANVPGSHCLQLNMEPPDASLQKVPLGHGVHTLDLVCAYDPAAHMEQTVRPTDAAIEPAAHEMHMDEPAVAENVPNGHCKQAATEVAARYLPKVPAAHSVQDA